MIDTQNDHELYKTIEGKDSEETRVIGAPVVYSAKRTQERRGKPVRKEEAMSDEREREVAFGCQRQLDGISFERFRKLLIH